MMTQPATGRAARLENVAALAESRRLLHPRHCNKPRISEETKQRGWMPPSNSTTLPTNPRPIPSLRHHRHYRRLTSDLQGHFSHRFLSARRTSCEPTDSVLLANARGDAALERQHVENCCPQGRRTLLIVQCEPTPGPRAWP